MDAHKLDGNSITDCPICDKPINPRANHLPWQKQYEHMLEHALEFQRQVERLMKQSPVGI